MINNYLIEFSLALILLIFTFFHFYKRYNNRKSIILIDVAIWTTGLAFGLSPFIYVFNGGSFKDNIIDVILSYLGIFLFIFGLNIVSKINNRIRKKFNEPNYFTFLPRLVNSISTKEVFFFYSFFFITRLYIAIEYNLFVSGSGTEATILNLPYSIVLIRDLIDLFGYASIVWAVSVLLMRKNKLLFPSLIIIIESLFMFFQGRRQIIFLFFIVFFVFIVSGYRLRIKYFIYAIIILFIANTVIFPSFLIFRDYYSFDNTRTNIIDDIAYNLNLTLSTPQDSYNYAQNIKVRVYINEWNISIIKKSGIYGGLNGNVFLLSAYWVIPKIFFQNKYSNITPENLINTYSFNYQYDSPENLPGYGFADFGLLGGLLYGIMFGLILLLVEKIAVRLSNKFGYASLLLMSSFIFVAFSVEQGLISVFAMIRSSIIIVIILAFIKMISNTLNINAKIKL
jgi:hypothetical protein